MAWFWGDTSVDWEGINESAEWLAKYMSRRGVIVLDWKEKYGEVRVNVVLRHPSPYFRHIVRNLRARYDFFIYRRAYKLILAKRPDLRDHIMDGADYPELLEGL